MFEPLPKFKFILSDGTTTWDLPQAPDGWEESFLEWQRSNERYGVIRSYSIPLKWVTDGAYFLRNKFYSGVNGIQSFTRIEILKLNPTTLEYLPFYAGTIDYSTFLDNPTNVTGGIMDSGLDERTKARGGTLYEFQMDDAEPVTIQGMELYESGTLTVSSISGFGPAMVPAIEADIKEEMVSFQAIKNVEEMAYPWNDRPYNDPLDDHYFYMNQNDAAVRIHGSLHGKIQSNGDEAFTYVWGFVSGGVFRIIKRLNFPQTGEFTEFPYEFSFDITMFIYKNAKLYLYAEPEPFDADWPLVGSTFDGDVLFIDYKVIYPTPTTTKAFRADVLFDKIIQKINGGIPNRTISFLLSNPPFNNLYYTSGDALRGIENATLKISLNDFLKDWFSIACAGFGIENDVAILERRDYFFRKLQKIGDLKMVKTAVFEVAEKYIYSGIKTGSPNQNLGEVNGRDEVNSEQTWTTPITRITQDYDIITASRTDAYGIETTRINLQEKKTTDAGSDNDTFILDTAVEAQGRRMAVRADRYLQASGILTPETTYNLWLSPKQNLLRHNYWLASAMWGMENYFINFQSALKNAQLVTVDLTGKTVKENETIPILTLGPKIYFPILATVQCIYDKNMADLINGTPYGYLEFVWMDNYYRGYILEASVNPANNEDKQFKLLLTSDNSLVNLRR